MKLQISDKILKKLMKNSILLVHNTELWGNKEDGLSVKLMKT